MDTNDAHRRRPRRLSAAPIEYTVRRLRSLLLVPAARAGIAGLVIAEAAGLGHELAIVAGLAAFLGATAAQTMILSPRSSGGRRPSPTALDSGPTWNK